MLVRETPGGLIHRIIRAQISGTGGFIHECYPNLYQPDNVFFYINQIYQPDIIHQFVFRFIFLGCHTKTPLTNSLIYKYMFQDEQIGIQKLAILMKTSNVFLVLRDDLLGFEHC